MDKAKERILCVDDEEDIRELVAFILLEYEVISAPSKADAMKQVTNEKYDLIILDYYLLDGTGLEICLMIRDVDKETPILFCTSSNDINEEQAHNAGAQGLINKELAFQGSLEVLVPQLLCKSRDDL